MLCSTAHAIIMAHTLSGAISRHVDNEIYASISNVYSIQKPPEHEVDNVNSRDATGREFHDLTRPVILFHSTRPDRPVNRRLLQISGTIVDYYMSINNL